MRQQLDLSRRLRARIEELEAARREPVAVIGTAMRFPGGVRTPQDFWRFLEGEDTTETPFPADRPGLRSVVGEAGPGRSYVDRASFIEQVDQFDAGFFGISAREAHQLDPQQRLLLETCWEASERAGLPIRRQDRLSGGVFVGIMTSEYGHRFTGREDKSGLDPYYGTGGGHSMTAGRVSYCLGLSGPAVSVDTACSSSLMAAHLAVQSLRRGECDYAFVGGANLIFSADMLVSLCQSRALAPDGRCKSFQDAADGYGRGEGIGVVLLSRLSVAERGGHPVLALIRGSAANHDGASSGLTVPNGTAQREVIRLALADAGVPASEMGYLEAHGTGTKVGDPIEITAIDAVLGIGAAGRRTPLRVGTVKARMGHLEGAAGVSSLITAVQVVSQGRIPGFVPESAGPLNALVRWEDSGLRVQRRLEPWPAGYARRLAGVSSFGMSGTNVHLVLEQYDTSDTAGPSETAGPSDTAGPAPSGWPELVTLSAKDDAALRDAAVAAADFFATADERDLADACHTLRVGRVHHTRRWAMVADSRQALVAVLRAVAAGDTDNPGVAAAEPVRWAVTASPAQVDRVLTQLEDRFPALRLTADGEPEARVGALLEALGLPVGSRIDPAGHPVAASGVVTAAIGDQVAVLNGDLPPVPAFLRFVAALYQAGAPLDLRGLGHAGARILPTLPTYPFQRRRYWVEEPQPDTVAAAGTRHDAIPMQATKRHHEVTEEIFTSLGTALAAEEALDRTLSFLDVGGDSFTAMHVIMDLESRYGISLGIEDIDLNAPLASMVETMAHNVVAALPEDASGERGPVVPGADETVTRAAG